MCCNTIEKIMKSKSGKIIGALVIAIILFVVLLFVQYLMGSGAKQKIVVVAKNDLIDGAVVTEENYRDFFTQKSVNENMVPSNAITNKNELINKQTLHFISKNEVVTQNHLCPDVYKEENYKEPTTVTIQAGNISHVLAGKIRSGQLITIYDVPDNTKEAVVLSSDAYVSKVFDAEGKRILNTDSESSAIILEVIVSKEDVQKVVEANTKGHISVIKPKGLMIVSDEQETGQEAEEESSIMVENEETMNSDAENS